MSVLTLNAVAVSGTNVYKSLVTRNGRGEQHVFSLDWDISGTVTGTLVVETSDSDRELVDQDAQALIGADGSPGYTDRAKWRALAVRNDVTGVAATSIAISNTSADTIRLAFMTSDAIRFKYTNATGSGVLTTRCGTRSY